MCSCSVATASLEGAPRGVRTLSLSHPFHSTRAMQCSKLPFMAWCRRIAVWSLALNPNISTVRIAMHPPGVLSKLQSVTLTN
eukprot:1996797-Amphidinium_carterae.1